MANNGLTEGHFCASVQRTSSDGYPHPGCFAKRGWKLLILMGVDFFGAHKRLQEHDSEGVSLAGGCRGRVGRRGNMREVIISVYRLSSAFLEKFDRERYIRAFVRGNSLAL